MAQKPPKKATKQPSMMATIKQMMDMRNAAARSAKRQPSSQLIQNGGYSPSPSSFGAGMGSPGAMTN